MDKEFEHVFTLKSHSSQRTGLLFRFLDSLVHHLHRTAFSTGAMTVRRV